MFWWRCQLRNLRRPVIARVSRYSSTTKQPWSALLRVFYGGAVVEGRLPRGLKVMSSWLCGQTILGLHNF